MLFYLDSGDLIDILIEINHRQKRALIGGYIAFIIVTYLLALFGIPLFHFFLINIIEYLKIFLFLIKLFDT